MVRERKLRDDKDRHEFAWNPDDSWQILRRCPNYILAANQFLKAAKAAGDNVSLRAFELVSLDETKYDGPRNPFRYIPRWVRPLRGSKNRKQILRDQDDIFSFPRIPNPHFTRYSGRRTPGSFLIDTTTTHYKKFYEWYGDLLLFPISPHCDRPRASALSSLWALYSVKVNKSFDLLDLKNDKLVNLSLTINSSFSQTMIEDDIRMLLKSKLAGESTIKEKPRWSSEQFNGYLELLDFVYPGGKRIKVSHRDVGEQCAPRYVQQKVNRDRAVIDWAKDTRKYIEKKLFPIFNKPEPKPSKKRRF